MGYAEGLSDPNPARLTGALGASLLRGVHAAAVSFTRGAHLLAARLGMGHRRRHRHHHHWGPWSSRGRFFGPGEVRLALLSLLSDGPQHGYELMRQLEERSDGSYTASAGTVYPTLQQLEDEGLVRSQSVDGKKVCSLTPEGEREVRERAEEIERIWQRAKEWSDWGFLGDPEVVELARPVLKLVKAAHRTVRRSRGDAEVLRQVRNIVANAREEIESLTKRR